MTGLIFFNGALLFDNGQLALDQRCCCDGDANICCCPQFAQIPPGPTTVLATLRSADPPGLEGQTATLGVISAAECVAYRVTSKSFTISCSGASLVLTIDIICEGTDVNGFKMALGSGTSGCGVRPVGGSSGDFLSVDPVDATCDPLFLAFRSFEIFDSAAPGSCGTCDGLTFDVEIS